MTEKKRKILYWFLKISSVLVSCIIPILSIYERFPVWNLSHHKGKTIGVGGILSIIVILIVFRKSVFNFLSARLKLQHAPPIVAPAIMVVVSYLLMYIADFMRDLNAISWMCLVGCFIGMVLTYIAECIRGDRKDD